MGEIAEQLIDEKIFGYKEYYKPIKIRYKRTPAEKKIALIRKEIAINIKNGMHVQEARKNANLKYGKGWRERGLSTDPNNQWLAEDLIF